MYLNTVFKYNVFKYCPALLRLYLQIRWKEELILFLIKEELNLNNNKVNHSSHKNLWNMTAYAHPHEHKQNKQC